MRESTEFDSRGLRRRWIPLNTACSQQTCWLVSVCLPRGQCFADATNDGCLFLFVHARDMFAGAVLRKYMPTVVVNYLLL